MFKLKIPFTFGISQYFLLYLLISKQKKTMTDQLKYPKINLHTFHCFFLQLICSANPRQLKLSPHDDQIYMIFRKEFPNLKVGNLTEDDLKSSAGKEKWRKFIEKFNKLDDYTFGSLIRTDSSQEFKEDNAMFVVRMQFLAIEIARNREGYNDNIYQTYIKPN